MPSRQDDLSELHETEETINKSFLTGYRETFHDRALLWESRSLIIVVVLFYRHE